MHVGSRIAPESYSSAVGSGQSEAVVVKGNPVWQFQQGLDFAHAVMVRVTTLAAPEQPQGKVTKSAAMISKYA